MVHTRILKVGVVALTAMAIMAFGVGSVAADPAVFDVSLRVDADLTSTGVIPGAMGMARVDLNIADGMFDLTAEARAEGLPSEYVFSLCLNYTLLDHAVADENGEVVLKGDSEGSLMDLPGHMLKVKAGFGCDGETVLKLVKPMH